MADLNRVCWDIKLIEGRIGDICTKNAGMGVELGMSFGGVFRCRFVFFF